ncbi:MAG: fumarylacetoacetate hydrolase family protein [Anaerolineae bacterium]
MTVRIVRCIYQHQPTYGIVQGEAVHRLRAGNPFAGPPEPAEPIGRLDELRLLPPCEPTKIIAVGRNYAAHAAEQQVEVPAEPLLFLKPPSALVGHEEPIILPAESQHVDHEAELVVVIGRRGKDIRREEAMQYIFGCTCGNDVTARDLQRRDGQWTRGKGFDTFAPLGPWIETDISPADLRVLCRVNGQVRQDGRTRDMIFDIPFLVSYISHIMTLEPGDVIYTGTPAGIGPLTAGDVVEVEIEGIGILRNPVQGKTRR